MRFIIISLLIVFISSANIVLAESVETKNGNIYEGEIVSITPSLIVIKTNDGKVKVKRSKIKKIEQD